MSELKKPLQSDQPHIDEATRRFLEILTREVSLDGALAIRQAALHLTLLDQAVHREWQDQWIKWVKARPCYSPEVQKCPTAQQCPGADFNCNFYVDPYHQIILPPNAAQEIQKYAQTHSSYVENIVDLVGNKIKASKLFTLMWPHYLRPRLKAIYQTIAKFRLQQIKNGALKPDVFDELIGDVLIQSVTDKNQQSFWLGLSGQVVTPGCGIDTLIARLCYKPNEEISGSPSEPSPWANFLGDFDVAKTDSNFKLCVGTADDRMNVKVAISQFAFCSAVLSPVMCGTDKRLDVFISPDISYLPGSVASVSRDLRSKANIPSISVKDSNVPILNKITQCLLDVSSDNPGSAFDILTKIAMGGTKPELRGAVINALAENYSKDLSSTQDICSASEKVIGVKDAAGQELLWLDYLQIVGVQDSVCLSGTSAPEVKACLIGV